MKITPEQMAVSVCDTIRANVDNDKLSDADFREFVRRSLPVPTDKKVED